MEHRDTLKLIGIDLDVAGIEEELLRLRNPERGVHLQIKNVNKKSVTIDIVAPEAATTRAIHGLLKRLFT